MAKIRADLIGGVTLRIGLDPVTLYAGNEIPEGAAIGDHLVETGGSTGEQTRSEPPRTGRGASRSAWADYASRIGVEYDDGASREDIIAAVDASRG